MNDRPTQTAPEVRDSSGCVFADLGVPCEKVVCKVCKNEWRETVRDIYDELICRHGDRILAQTIVRMIERRHSAFFGAKDVTNG